MYMYRKPIRKPIRKGVEEACMSRPRCFWWLNAVLWTSSSPPSALAGHSEWIYDARYDVLYAIHDISYAIYYILYTIYAIHYIPTYYMPYIYHRLYIIYYTIALF